MEEEKLFDAATYLKSYCEDRLDTHRLCNCPFAHKDVDCVLWGNIPAYWDWEDNKEIEE